MIRNKKIYTYYTPKQVCINKIKDLSFSKSPLKPKLLMERIDTLGFSEMLDKKSDFKPFEKESFFLAHSKQYVENVFNKTGNYKSNDLPWSKNLVNSLGYTNASLYHAKRHAILHPESVTFAPISGMHHARPNGGSGFCTFSGQVISAIKIYEEFGLSGAYFDLDGHYGNSIEDTREFNPLLNKAIPQGCNVNPFGNNEEYTADFARKLDLIGNQIKLGKIHYVVFAHGADSHMDDDLGWNCDTYHWVKCAEMFANWVNEISNEIGKPLPVTLALFGGYRKNNYTAVLDLHIKSILKISNIVCGTSFKDNLEIPEKYPSLIK
jgi:acetoin utilization deacetylase AcuC-like enzyme